MGLCPKRISEKASRVELTARQWPLLPKCHGQHPACHPGAGGPRGEAGVSGEQGGARPGAVKGQLAGAAGVCRGKGHPEACSASAPAPWVDTVQDAERAGSCLLAAVPTAVHPGPGKPAPVSYSRRDKPGCFLKTRAHLPSWPEALSASYPALVSVCSPHACHQPNKTWAPSLEWPPPSCPRVGDGCDVWAVGFGGSQGWVMAGGLCPMRAPAGNSWGSLIQ